jgi:hypothetical protein
MKASQSHRRTIITSVFICLTVIYIGIGCTFIDKYYTQPNKIKNNQMITTCNATFVEYELRDSTYVNGSYINEYSVARAQDQQGHDITNVYSDFRCIIECPAFIIAPCYNYKTYFAKNREDINAKFNRVSYLCWFILYWFGILLIYQIGILCHFIIMGH